MSMWPDMKAVRCGVAAEAFPGRSGVEEGVCILVCSVRVALEITLRRQCRNAGSKPYTYGSLYGDSMQWRIKRPMLGMHLFIAMVRVQSTRACLRNSSGTSEEHDTRIVAVRPKDWTTARRMRGRHTPKAQ